MLRRRWEVLPYYTNPPGHTGQDHPMCGEPAEPGTMAIEKFWTRWFAERAARSCRITPAVLVSGSSSIGRCDDDRGIRFAD